MLARVYVLKRPFQGLPTLEDFDLVEETLPEEIEEGGMSTDFIPLTTHIFNASLLITTEILTKAEWLTVDPYMRLRTVPGTSFPGGQVAR